MRELIEFKNCSVTDGSVTGFEGQSSRWEKYYDSIRAVEQTDDFATLTVAAGGEVENLDMVSLSLSYKMVNMSKPTGSTRGMILRQSGDTSIVVDVVLETASLILRIREKRGARYTEIGRQRFGTWSTMYAEYLTRVRVRAQGSRISAKIWWDCEDEPDQWDISTTTEIVGPGKFGIVATGFSVLEYVWLAYSTDYTEPPQGPEGMISEEYADFRGFKPLVESMCWPLYNNGKSADPRSLCHPDDDRESATLGFRSARARAIKLAIKNRTPIPPPGEVSHGYSHCSRFAGTLILNTIDPLITADYTLWQNEYLENPHNGWIQVGSSEYYDPSWCKPGDIWLTREAGHVFVWVGDHGGYNDVIAEGAFNGLDEKYGKSRTGSLRRHYVNNATGDNIGRHYSVWRYRGKPEIETYYQTPTSLQKVDLYLQTKDNISPYSV